MEEEILYRFKWIYKIFLLSLYRLFLSCIRAQYMLNKYKLLNMAKEGHLKKIQGGNLYDYKPQYDGN